MIDRAVGGATITAVHPPAPPVPRYALIPTHNRPAELAAALASLAGQLGPDGIVVVVDNASDPPVDGYNLPSGDDLRVAIVCDDEQPPNLSRLWNVGLDLVAQYAERAGHTVWDVAVLNDDAMVPARWFTAVATALRAGPAVTACSDPYGTLTAPLLKTAPDNDLSTRMCPWAFVTRGEAKLRADEQFRWWFGDTQWDWDSRASGGVAIVPGYAVRNMCANTTTVGALAEQAGRDRAAFAAKYGRCPW